MPIRVRVTAVTESRDFRPDIDRIRANLDKWEGIGEGGSYQADARDYGQTDVTILRDIRCLLEALDALWESSHDFHDRDAIWTYDQENKVKAQEAYEAGVRFRRVLFAIRGGY